MFSICPCCGSSRSKPNLAQVEETWRLMGLYYDLGDGVAWVSQSHLVTFESRASAEAFKAQAPTWTCQYLAPGAGINGMEVVR